MEMYIIIIETEKEQWEVLMSTLEYTEKVIWGLGGLVDSLGY